MTCVGNECRGATEVCRARIGADVNHLIIDKQSVPWCVPVPWCSPVATSRVDGGLYGGEAGGGQSTAPPVAAAIHTPGSHHHRRFHLHRYYQQPPANTSTSAHSPTPSAPPSQGTTNAFSDGCYCHFSSDRGVDAAWRRHGGAPLASAGPQSCSRWRCLQPQPQTRRHGTAGTGRACRTGRSRRSRKGPRVATRFRRPKRRAGRAPPPFPPRPTPELSLADTRRIVARRGDGRAVQATARHTSSPPHKLRARSAVGKKKKNAAAKRW